MSSSDPINGSSSNPPVAQPDPRVEELLRRVAALEQRLASIDVSQADASHIEPPPVALHSAAKTVLPETHDAFIERLAHFKRDARAQRIGRPAASGSVDAPAADVVASIPSAANVSALPAAPPTAPPKAVPDAPMPVIYAAPATYAPAVSVSPVVYPPPVVVGGAMHAGIPPRPPVAVSPTAAPSHAVPPVVARPKPPTAKPAKPAMSLESLIGFKGFMFVGSLILIVGVIMGMKFGIDQGWFKMPPAVRCIGAAMFGVLLLGAGEWARRKINALASAGLSAAGIATMYGAAWVAYGHYGLVDAPVGFALLGAAAAIGIVVALRAGLVSVAVVSLLGAYIAPWIATTPNPSPLVLPAYLIALLTLGLVLSARRPRPFRALRGVVWWGTVIMGTAAVFYAADVGKPMIGLGFLAIVWAAVHAELWYGARKAPEALGPVEAKGLSWRATRPVLSTFATTMWAAAIGVWSLSWATGGIQPPDWFVTAAIAVAAGVVAMILAGNLRVLIDTPENDGERLGAALMAQAGALVVATVVLALAGRAEVLAGILIGVAAVFAGRWIKSRSLDVYGLIVLALTVGRMVMYDSWRGTITGPRALGSVFLGLSITEWTLLMCFAAAGWAAAGVLLVRSQASGMWRSLGAACMAIALCVAFAGFISPHSEMVSVLVLAILLCVGAFGVGNAVGSIGLLVIAMVAMAASCVAAIGLQAQRPETISWAWQGGGIMLSRWGMAMLLAALAWAGFAAVLRKNWTARAAEWSAAVIACAAAAGVMLFLSVLAPGSHTGPVAWVWLGLGIGLFAVHHLFPRLAIDVMGFAGLLAATGLWAITYLPSDWVGSARPIGLHPGLVQGLALAAALWCSAVVLWKRSGKVGAATFPEALRSVVAGAVGLIFISTSLEVRRAAMTWFASGADDFGERAALSIWWGLFGLALIGVGFWRRVPLVRHSGLALMAIAAGKAVIFDLADVPAGWRAASFLGLGLMMLAVGLVYAKAHANLEKAGAPDEPAEVPGDTALPLDRA